MVGRILAWLSALLEMHPEMLQYTVRVHVWLLNFIHKKGVKWKKGSYKPCLRTSATDIQVLYVCHLISFTGFFLNPPPLLLTHSPARSPSLPDGLAWPYLSPLLPQDPTHQWRNANHKFCLAVEAELSRKVERGHTTNFRWNICSL